jgi:hypothetical protein
MITPPRLLLLTLAFCAAQPAGAVADEPVPKESIRYLDQGWTETDRAWFYTTTQGSRMIPYDWFLALERPGAEGLFKDRSYMEQFGYLPALDESESRDGLPIGFVADGSSRVDAYALKAPMLRRGMDRGEYRRRSEAMDEGVTNLPSEGIQSRSFASPAEGENRPFAAPTPKEVPIKDFPQTTRWLGLTCAACHTAQIEHGGKAVRVDGGPSLSDFTGFSERLVEALLDTAEEQERFDRFAGRVLGPKHSPGEAENLRKQLVSYTEGFAGLVARSKPVHPYGFGRLDAFGILLNEIVGTAMALPENYRVPDAPVSYPFLWDTPDLDWVQWNGASHNPLARNIGEVLGVFADLNLSGPATELFDTSAHLPNLVELEERIKSLRPPAWPEDVLGPINKDLAEKGKVHYETFGCIDCHAVARPYPMTEPNSLGRSLIAIKMIPVEEIRTDPKAALNFLQRTAAPGPFAGELGQDPAPVARLLAVSVRKVIAVQFDKLRLSEAERLRYLDRRVDKAPTPAHLASYKARPLAGVWSTAPYLHNGSVPSLHDLLLPASKRSPQFHIGSRCFDPARVGFIDDEEGSEFRTDLPGNSNAGHEYGAEMDDTQRLELLEYLKTL